MTKQFSKWASRQDIPENELYRALEEVQAGRFEANLGGHIYKKRIRFEGKGKSGSRRTISKNEKSNLSRKELFAFKELSKILVGLSVEKIKTAIEAGDFIEVKSCKNP